MGLFNAILGNSSEVNPEAIKKEYSKLFLEDEAMEFACKLIRDTWIFTNKRLIMIDVQGLTGSKKEFHSVPYRSIYHFAVESAGTFDMDSEFKIWVAGQSTPIVKQLKKGFDVMGLQQILAYYTCAR